MFGLAQIAVSWNSSTGGLRCREDDAITYRHCDAFRIARACQSNSLLAGGTLFSLVPRMNSDHGPGNGTPAIQTRNRCAYTPDPRNVTGKKGQGGLFLAI